MEFDVNSHQNNNRQSLPTQSSGTAHLYQTKLPVRVASEKHCYKRHSWLLPEGQTVVEKQYQLGRKKRGGDNLHVRIPQITFYVDICTLLKNLFHISCDQFKDLSKSESSIELQESYKSKNRLILQKEKKVDDLLELYIHQQHMREGATNLLKTLESVKNINKSTKQRIEECKLQREKNIDRLLSIEDELNSMAGSLKFQILGLAGFSRVCPGDVYEVSFKLASQKWKSKCKIEALGQTWIDPEFCFQGKAAYDMNVKMVEIGKLGKTTVIGSISCSIQEFLLPEPQVYMLPINSTGTIKLKLGVIWSPIDTNDSRQLANRKKPSMFATIDFSNTPVVNLRSVQQNNKYSSPLQIPNTGGDYLNASYPPPIYRTPSTNARNNSESSSHTSGIYGSNPTTPVNKGVFRSSSSSLEKSAAAESVLDELRRKTSLNAVKPNHHHTRSTSDINSNPSNGYIDSGYQSSSREDLQNHRRHSVGSIDPVQGPPPQKSSSTSYLTQFGEIPENVPVYNAVRRITADSGPIYNEVRTTTVPVQSNGIVPHNLNIQHDLNSRPGVSSPHVVNGSVPLSNGHVSKVVLRKISLPDKYTSSSNSNDIYAVPVKTPPSVKVKPKVRRASSLGPIIEGNMQNEKDATPRMIELCEKIIDKLLLKPEIKDKIRDLERKFNELKASLEQLQAKQQRRPSYTDSIASALASFSFLKDDDEHSVISDYAPPKARTVFILTNQWKQSHRALCHHMYMLYDAIDMYEPSSRPLCERENIIIQCIHKQKFFIKEILELISTPDDIEINSVCKQFTGSSTLTNTWEVSASVEQPLFCTSAAILETFSALYQHLEIEDGGDGTTTLDVKLKEKVCSQATFKLFESNIYGTDNNIITLFQFADFFKTKVKSHSVIGFLRSLKHEELSLRGLKSKDDLVVMSVLQQYWSIPVVESCVYCLLLFTVNSKSSTKTLAMNALIKLYEGESKQLLLNILFIALEERDIKLRAAACAVFGKCKVHTSSQKLIYIFENDDVIVRSAAEVALKELGRTHIKR